VQDRVDARVNSRAGQHDADYRADGKQCADACRALVKGLDWRPGIRIRPVVEVVHTFLPGALDELVQHRLAPRREGLTCQVGDGLPKVVPCPSQLGDDHVEGLGRGGCRVLPA